MRHSVLSTMCLAAAGVLFSAGSPAMAQYYSGTRNSEVGSIGDLDENKLRSKTSGYFGLQFGPTGLFAGSDVYEYDTPRPFVFPLPIFGSVAGYDFSDMTFDQYLDIVASSYDLPGAGAYQGVDYLTRFSFSNPVSNTGGLLMFQTETLTNAYLNAIEAKKQEFRDQFGVDDLGSLPDAYIDYINQQLQIEDFIQIQTLEPLAALYLHQEDFRAGGGYVVLTEDPIYPEPPVIPTDPGDDDPVDPFEPLPEPTSNVAEESELLSNIAEDVDADTLDTLESLLSQTSASSSETAAPQVTALPEPATLGLMALAVGGALIRRR